MCIACAAGARLENEIPALRAVGWGCEELPAMKLLIDAVGNRNGGGLEVLKQLLDAAAPGHVVDEMTLLISPAAMQELRGAGYSRVRIIEVSHAEGAVGRLHWALVGLDRAMAQLPGHVFFGLNGLAGTRARNRKAVFIQQSIPYSREAMRLFDWRMRIRMRMIGWLTKRSAKAADAVFVQTEVMRRCVVDAFKIPLDKTQAFRPCAPKLRGGLRREEERSIDAAKTTLLYVGNAQAHKNLAVVERGLALVPAQQRPMWKVTLTAEEVASYPMAVPLGQLTRAQLADAYASADILVMPSVVETVGLPLLEAMQERVPILAADRPYAHEICGDAAVFFDPLSASDFANKLLLLSSDANLRRKLIARGLDCVANAGSRRPYESLLKALQGLAHS
jgi:hypothetical protein